MRTLIVCGGGGKDLVCFVVCLGLLATIVMGKVSSPRSIYGCSSAVDGSCPECDGHMDCFDLSDEQDCESKSRERPVTFSNTFQSCDGVVDGLKCSRQFIEPPPLPPFALCNDFFPEPVSITAQTSTIPITTPLVTSTVTQAPVTFNATTFTQDSIATTLTVTISSYSPLATTHITDRNSVTSEQDVASSTSLPTTLTTVSLKSTTDQNKDKLPTSTRIPITLPTIYPTVQPSKSSVTKQPCRTFCRTVIHQTTRQPPPAPRTMSSYGDIGANMTKTITEMMSSGKTKDKWPWTKFPRVTKTTTDMPTLVPRPKPVLPYLELFIFCLNRYRRLADVYSCGARIIQCFTQGCALQLPSITYPATTPPPVWHMPLVSRLTFHPNTFFQAGMLQQEMLFMLILNS